MLFTNKSENIFNSFNYCEYIWKKTGDLIDLKLSHHSDTSLNNKLALTPDHLTLLSFFLIVKVPV